jgi:hypothetical protein
VPDAGRPAEGTEATHAISWEPPVVLTETFYGRQQPHHQQIKGLNGVVCSENCANTADFRAAATQISQAA